MAKNDIWTTKDGRNIKICEMTDSHLKNAMRLFEPTKKYNKERWKLLITEKERRDKLVPDESIDSRAAVSWWCVNKKAKKERGTPEPGCQNCEFWKKMRCKEELGFIEKLTTDFIFINIEG